MNEYRVKGRNAATDATADDAVATLWNPSTAKPIWVLEISLHNTTAATAQVEITRQSTRGTPGSTVTPDIDNDIDHELAPLSGTLLDLGAAGATEGTKLGPAMEEYWTAATIGAGKIWNFRANPIRVKAGAGLAIVAADAVAVPACSVGFCWRE